MRILIATIAASLPLTLSAAPVPKAPAPPLAQAAKPGEQCDKFALRRTDDGTPVQARKLGELPPGNLQLAVMRQVDGCYQPTIVRYGYGAVRTPERGR